MPPSPSPTTAAGASVALYRSTAPGWNTIHATRDDEQTLCGQPVRGREYRPSQATPPLASETCEACADAWLHSHLDKMPGATLTELEANARRAGFPTTAVMPALHRLLQQARVWGSSA